MKDKQLIDSLKLVADELLKEIWGKPLAKANRLSQLMGEKDFVNWMRKYEESIYTYIAAECAERKKIQFLDKRSQILVPYYALGEAVRVYESAYTLIETNEIHLDTDLPPRQVCVEFLKFLHRAKVYNDLADLKIYQRPSLEWLNS